MTRLLALAACSLQLMAAALGVGQAGAAGTLSAPTALRPSLDGAPSPDPYPRVIGQGWAPHASIAVTVRYFGLRAGTHVHTTAAGRFGLGLQGVRWCTGLIVTARDTLGHKVRLHGTSALSPCSGPAPGTRIVLHILSTRQMRFQEVVVPAEQPLSLYTVHVGDVLNVYVAGTGQPRILPTADTTHFQLLERGTVPSCPPGADCVRGPGFYWRFQATVSGDATVVLSFACRQSHPPCMAPDRLVRVHILT